MAALRLGTRGSLLATTQSGTVADLLRAQGQAVELVVVRTEGDDLRVPLDAPSRPGAFVAALRDVLLDGGVDFVVHSFKDLPSDPVPGLSVVAVPRRADVADVLVTHDGSSLGDLPSGARVGTSSPRRAAGLLRHRPDLEIVPVRGNVDTRVGAISAGRVDAVVLAAAGLQRLGRDEVPAVPIPFDVLLPAPAQGALAIECRTGEDTCDLLAQLDDSRARVEVAAERAILAGVEAQCTTAVGALAVLDETGLTLHAELSDHAGVDYRRLSRTVPGGVDIESAAEIGRQLARDLISPA